MSLITSYAAGIGELVAGFQNWRIWHLLGTADLRRRHSRSKFGQLWITLSTGVTILSLGLVWSLLWRVPVAGIIPYITVAMIFWGFISGVLNESTLAFTSMGNIFLNQKTSFAVAIYTLIYRSLIATAYNLAIVVVVFLWFWTWPGWGVVLIAPGLILTLACLIPVCYVLAIIATRYRDAVPLTQSITQIGYFITPILWKPEFIPEPYRWINSVNPFSIYLSLLRDPLLAIDTPAMTWLVAAAYAICIWTIALPFIGAYYKRVIYWI